MTIRTLFGRRTTAVDPRIRGLQVDLREAREQATRLAARLRAEGARADRAEEALNDFRDGIRSGHDDLLRLVAQQQREMAQLRRDRDGALSQLDAALGYDAKTLATINAGGAKAAA
ncbi:hypothetical protein AB0O91_21190 [Kitasatospora sp. NPDC089797]|uniref:hypothetical protein n=1 Tax=Kitasatospora sp. NPDC089797 TaxID=3155298 RepID=UPI0034268A10